MAFAFTKDFTQVVYSLGTVDKSGGGYLVGLDVDAGMMADRRHGEWHSTFHPVMRPLTQST